MKQELKPSAQDSLLTFADDVAHQGVAVRAEAAEPERHLVIFSLDREEFGIPIARAREIVRVPEITRVPQAPPHIRGVMNLRGRILPVVEIRTRFGLERAELTSRSRVVVVEAHGRMVGIWARERTAYGGYGADLAFQGRPGVHDVECPLGAQATVE